MRDGASQSLMNMAAVDTAKIPTRSPTKILTLDTSIDHLQTGDMPSQPHGSDLLAPVRIL